MRLLLGLLVSVGILIGLIREASQADELYPSRSITLVVPVPPGGAADFIARLLGQKLSERLGQSVIISNRSGASGTIASDNVAKSAPDGYTLLLNSITTHGIGPHLYTSLPYDPGQDFAPIALVADLPLIMTIYANHSMNSVAEVVDYAKANRAAHRQYPLLSKTYIRAASLKGGRLLSFEGFLSAKRTVNMDNRSLEGARAVSEYMLVVEMDIPLELESEFNRIYDHDHIPKIMKVAGVLGVDRYALEESDAKGIAKYIAMYRITSPAVAKSAEWRAAADIGEWMPKIRPHTFNRTRSTYRKLT